VCVATTRVRRRRCAPPWSRRVLQSTEPSGGGGGRVRQLAQLVGADAKEIIFTSGATESNNIAIKGVAGFYKSAFAVRRRGKCES
jgi:hypothetical protein